MSYRKPIYTPPTRNEIRWIVEFLKLTGFEAGRVGGLTGKTPGRQVRRYTGGQCAVPFSFLYTLIHRSVSIRVSEERWREELSHMLENG